MIRFLKWLVGLFSGPKNPDPKAGPKNPDPKRGTASGPKVNDPK
jgi:hypothetical protein